MSGHVTYSPRTPTTRRIVPASEAFDMHPGEFIRGVAENLAISERDIAIICDLDPEIVCRVFRCEIIPSETFIGKLRAVFPNALRAFEDYTDNYLHDHPDAIRYPD